MLKLIDRIHPLVILGITSWIALAVLEVLPDGLFAEVRYVSSTLSFLIMALSGLILIRLFRLQIWAYFRLPEKSKLTFAAFAVVAVVTVPPIFSVDRDGKSLSMGLLAIFFLFSIGLGEEIFSRGFHYGYLENYGRYLAVVVSSFVFGLMHLNRYIGDGWDSWRAYSHVVTAFGFGLLACALMIATKSIWVAVLFHTLANWDLAFPRVGVSNTQIVLSEQFLGRLLMPVMHLSFSAVLAFVLLWFSAGSGLPQLAQRLMVSWKLVETERN